MKRLTTMLVAMWPTLLVLSAVGLFCLWKDAQWPSVWHSPEARYTPVQLEAIRTGAVGPTISWQDLLIFGGAVAWLGIKCNMMLRRMQVIDWLTISVVVTNMVFAALYFLVVIGALFPYWFATHPDDSEWIKRGLRIGLVVSLVWGVWSLTGVPDPNGPPSRRETIIATIAFAVFLIVVLVIGASQR